MLIKYGTLDQNVLELLVRATYPRPDAIERLQHFYSAGQSREVFGWSVDGQVVCALGIERHPHRLEITHIASLQDRGGQGYGRALITAVREATGIHVFTAETDDHSVGFYRKCGFVCEELNSPYETKRYQCVLTPNSSLGNWS
ncbi:GNAT family N-acetyltransferase [Deinococcus sonorensis]|uniref:GNAT family N-acetyltransferase n=1 Tax=Deinococcus sonorensis TaxID=309891 RepID=A0ABV8YBD8_9DEIO